MLTTIKPVKNKIKNNMENELYQLQELRFQTTNTIRDFEEQIKGLKRQYAAVSQKYNSLFKADNPWLKTEVRKEIKLVSDNLFKARANLKESKNRKTLVVTELRHLNTLINQNFPYVKA